MAFPKMDVLASQSIIVGRCTKNIKNLPTVLRLVSVRKANIGGGRFDDNIGHDDVFLRILKWMAESPQKSGSRYNKYCKRTKTKT